MLIKSWESQLFYHKRLGKQYLSHLWWANWQIYKKKSGTGNFFEDFNDALANLYADQVFINTLTEISALQDKAGGLIKDLAKHPSSFDEEYSDFREFFDLFLKFTNMSRYAIGSLASFKEDHNKLDVEIAGKLQELRFYFN